MANRNVLIVNFNTPEMVEAAILSLRKHGGEEYEVTVFDNSDSRPFTKKMEKVSVLDNSLGQLIDLDAEIHKFPDLTTTSVGTDAGKEWVKESDGTYSFTITSVPVGTVYEVTETLATFKNTEISKIERRQDGPNGIQYSLRAASSGYFPNVRGGEVYMNAGEVWKYGETTLNPPESRYRGKEELRSMNLIMYYEASGTQKQMKRAEKIKLYDYFLKNGHLPPGNKIFR